MTPLDLAGSSAVTTHIQLLQGIISRLADNSASCKNWCLTIVAALLSLGGALHVTGIAATGLIPVVMFSILDALYLSQERAYRDLYGRTVKAVRKGNYAGDDIYDARAPISPFDVLKAMGSWSIYPFYGGLILIYVVAERTGWLAALAVTPVATAAHG